MLDPEARIGRTRGHLQSEMPNFNEMVSLQSMVNPHRKPIRHMSSKLNKMHRRSRRRFMRPAQKSPFSFDSKNELQVQLLDITKNSQKEQDENFRTFAPDEEEEKKETLPGRRPTIEVQMLDPEHTQMRQ